MVDLYTKTGGVGSYGFHAVLIPDHDIAFTVLVVGHASAVDFLAEMDV